MEQLFTHFISYWNFSIIWYIKSSFYADKVMEN